MTKLVVKIDAEEDKDGDKQGKLDDLRIKLKSLQKKKKTLTEIPDSDIDSSMGDTSLHGDIDAGVCGRIDEELEAIDCSVDGMVR